LIPNSILFFYYAASAGWEGGRLLTIAAGVSGGEKSYLDSSIILNNYPALSATIGGRDGMDGSRSFWMTLPFLEVPSISGPTLCPTGLRSLSLLVSLLLSFIHGLLPR